MTPEQIVQDAKLDKACAWQLYVQTDIKKSEDMLARRDKLSDKIRLVALTVDASRTRQARA